jgi:hypothetical protein
VDEVSLLPLKVSFHLLYSCFLLAFLSPLFFLHLFFNPFLLDHSYQC